MQQEDSEYIPVELLVNTKNEASVRFVYKPQQLSKGAKTVKMVYEILLKNIYEIENPTKEGVIEKIFADHPFLKKSDKMVKNMNKAVDKIFEERAVKKKAEKERSEITEIQEDKEGSAAKIPTIKNK
ncbi:unnamed protein product [Paramecium primaurelia]|uniref:Uncharacterized protein n=1 Tax=Paramecium primaurelia TaxID=5886 RepID=A0A8S1N1M4_PARPR|nr:unnamed protein product [Paramecium primaurelia]